MLTMTENYCPTCGAELKYTEAEICPACGVRIRKPVPEKKKEPILAAILSFFFGGSGQVYNGELGKGILILLGTILGAFLFIIPGIIVWIYGIYDAYTVANQMNLGQIEFKEATGESIIAYILVYFAAIILAIVLVFFVVLALAGVFLAGVL
jgi:TM2 domain-containing membrane protein YozV